MANPPHRFTKVLARIFTKTEWDYLMGRERFKGAMETGGETLDDFERLCVLGDQLLRENLI
jgi:hypothetical protein